jgi:hypothetical protein
MIKSTTEKVGNAMDEKDKESAPDQREPSGAGEPAVPPASGTPAAPPPPVTPSQPGAHVVPPPSGLPGAQPRKPADYYAQPPAEVEKKGCGKWLVGCGIAGFLLLILIGAGLFWFATSGWPTVMAPMVTEVENHIERNGENIDPAVRAELQSQLTELKRHIRDGDVSLGEMQGVMFALRKFVREKDLTTAHAEELLVEVRQVNVSGSYEEF